MVAILSIRDNADLYAANDTVFVSYHIRPLFKVELKLIWQLYIIQRILQFYIQILVQFLLQFSPIAYLRLT